MKKINLFKIAVLLISSILFVGCAKTQEEKVESISSEPTKITIGSFGADAQVWEFIAQTEAAKAANLEIEVTDLSGGITLNQAVADGIIDVNAFQSIGYMKSFNDDAGEEILVPIALTYIEPMGIYSKKIKSLGEISEGAVVALPESPANMARALRLLESAGLITLSENFDDGTGTELDIVENPKTLTFKAIDDPTAVRVLEDVDLAVIGNTIAYEGGLNVLTDSLFKEEIDKSTISRINVLAAHKDRVNDENLKKLNELYHSEIVQEYVKEQFQGTKVEVTQTVEEVWGR